MCCLFFHRDDFRGWCPPASQFQLIQCYCYWAPATKHRGVTFSNLQWGYSPSSPSSASMTFTNLKCVLHRVHHSLFSSEATHQVHPVHQVWRSQISSVFFIKCDFYKCTIHWSLLRLLPVHRSPIPTVALLKLHHPAMNLHLLATILCD